MTYTKYEQVKQDFLSGRIKGCKNFFEKNNHYVEAGYCNIVLDNLKGANLDFEKAIGENVRAHWGKVLIQMINAQISSAPTYFEVRNFLEIDLSMLITYCKGDYVEKIIRYADFMAFYNMECYKFIGRVFWAHNLMPAAMFFLDRAKEKLFKDPELHYLLAYIHYDKRKDIKEAKKELEICLDILPEYAPAVKLLEIINNLK